MIDNCKKIFGKDLYRLYHENSSLNRYNINLFEGGISRVWGGYVNDFNSIVTENPYKNIKGKRIQLHLPENFMNDDYSLYKSILKRKSIRQFTGKLISQEDFSILIMLSCGLSKEDEKIAYHHFVYPSAGAIDSLRFVVIVRNVENIESGAYFYDQIENSLIKIENDNIIKILSLNCTYVENSSFSVHLLANIKYKSMKYGDRAYRFVNLEAGHVVQNIYLIAAAKKLGVVSSGAIMADGEEFLSNLLNEEVLALYEVFIGTTD